MTHMNIATILASIILSIVVYGAPEKHSLKNECKFNHLESGTYRCILPDDKGSFFVDCMMDGTMYINPGQQALYHYHKQAGLAMKFKLIVSAEYITVDDVDDEQIQSLSLKNNEDEEQDINEVLNDDDEIWGFSNGNNNQQQSENEEDDDASLNEDSLESQELTDIEKHSVNLTAQYIVYAVIIVMALIFSLGICLLIYWWCCREKMSGLHGLNKGNVTPLNTNDDDDEDETSPFIDIRGENTMNRRHSRSKHRSVYMNGTTTATTMGEEQPHDDILQQQRHNIYDDINGADDNEDGDDLIAHYGATTNADTVNAGYVIARFPNSD